MVVLFGQLEVMNISKPMGLIVFKKIKIYFSIACSWLFKNDSGGQLVFLILFGIGSLLFYFFKFLLNK